MMTWITALTLIATLPPTLASGPLHGHGATVIPVMGAHQADDSGRVETRSIKMRPKQDGTSPGGCPAAQFNDLIGKAAEAAQVVPDPKRLLRPDDKMTMDHRPDRTNIMLNDIGLITGLRCG